MAKKTLRDLLLGEANFSFRRMIITYAAIILLFSGLVLVITGVSGEGIIDVKMAFVEGKLQSGSIGLLFSFMGFLLLVPCFIMRSSNTLEVKRESDGSIQIKHKGAFTKDAAQSLQTLFGTSTTETANNSMQAMPNGAADA